MFSVLYKHFMELADRRRKEREEAEATRGKANEK